MNATLDANRSKRSGMPGPAPRFSIVVPVYNRASSIEPTLRSVQAQSYADFECIIVDDGSSDAELLRAVVEGFGDTRFRYVWQENGGGGAARNAGIAAARGDYVAFLDSDDLFLPDKLSILAQQLTDQPDVAFYTRALVDRGNDRYWARPDRAIRLGEDMGEYLFVHNQFIQTSTIVLPRAAAQQVRFDPSLRKGQDLDFCLRLHGAGIRFRMVEPALTIWYDVTEHNRTSRHAGHEAPAAWLARSDHLLTRRAAAGYRATVLAYYMGRSRPFTAARYLMNGWLAAGVPLSITVRQALRCFLPRGMYRSLIDWFVSVKGQEQHC
jgi:glycosyltransferase involved in cell wall biosynthesis